MPVRAIVPALVVLAACGQSSPRPPTCLQAGVALAASAGPDREGLDAAIGQACDDSGWAPAVIACAVDARTPDGCLAELTDEQRAAYLVLRQTWHPGRGFLGVQYVLADDRASARVVRVLSDSPAEQVGVRAGDQIVAFDAHSIDQVNELGDRVSRTPPGSRAVLVVRGEDGTQRVLYPTLAAKPAYALRP